MVRVAAYGGGVNSTAMIIGLTQQQIKIDAILFADTGGERPATYAYLKTFNSWLSDHGQPEIVTVKKVTENGQQQTLEGYCIQYNSLPSIAYGYKICSHQFKLQPQQKWVNHFEPARQEWAAGNKVIKYVGFDAGETRRAKYPVDKKYETRYPLIEWQWTRAQCKEEILKAGICLPPKSSCFFCPNMKKQEILALPDELKERAINIERNAAASLHKLKGLGRSYRWEDLIHADNAQQQLYEDLELYTPPCECID